MTKEFEEPLKTNDEGRYEVKLPRQKGHSTVPRNFSLANKRLQSTVRRLNKENLSEYNNVFEQ